MTQFDSYSGSEPTPQPPPHPARARRRSAQRRLFPSDAEGQATVLAELARRSFPSFDLFIYAILSGAIMAAGYLLDSQAVLIFGVLAAPLLTSWVGLSIAAITGSPRFFLQTFAALFVSAFIVFLIGLAAGFAELPFGPRTHNEIYPHSILSWANLIVVMLGAVLLVVTFVRTEEKPYLPSAVLSYAFYLPISAAGFGIGARLEGVWPQAALVALVHLAWATLFGILTLAIMRFRSRSIGGFIFSLLFTLAILAALFTWTGWGRSLLDFANGMTPPPGLSGIEGSASTATIFPRPFLTLTSSPFPNPSPSPSVTPSIASATASVTATEIAETETPAKTSTPSITIEPTPIFARINSPEGGGAFVRESPGGQYLLTLSNGIIVEVLGETQERMGVIWVKIAVERNGERTEGWIIQSLLMTATPVVNWEPTETPTPIP
jgi:hypothetical protein